MIESNGIKIHIKDGKSESKRGEKDVSSPEVGRPGGGETFSRKEARETSGAESTEITSEIAEETVAEACESGEDPLENGESGDIRKEERESSEEGETETPEEEPDYRDLYLRARAELENVQKTVPKRIQEGVERFKREHFFQLLELADGFDRAAAHIELMDTVSDQWKEGMESLRRISAEILSKAGVERIRTENAVFDPNRHEVVSALPVPGRKDGEILEELRSGWTLDGRLLRAALVVVVRNGE